MFRCVKELFLKKGCGIRESHEKSYPPTGNYVVLLRICLFLRICRSQPKVPKDVCKALNSTRSIHVRPSPCVSASPERR